MQVGKITEILRDMVRENEREGTGEQMNRDGSNSKEMEERQKYRMTERCMIKPVDRVSKRKIYIGRMDR